MAFFGLSGYAIGMWLMWARTEVIVQGNISAKALPPTPDELHDAIGTQILGVVGTPDIPLVWAFAHSPPLQLAMLVLIPGLLAPIFGWLAFRSRVTSVYLSILTQAMTLALRFTCSRTTAACAATTAGRTCKTFRAFAQPRRRQAA